MSMTPEERASQISGYHGRSGDVPLSMLINHFRNAIADEREACAAVADRLGCAWLDGLNKSWADPAQDIAAAIRSRRTL